MNNKSDLEAPNKISYNDIAKKLINDKFLLTALELHTELVESGREISQLKEFFSNPANFEQPRNDLPSAPITRSGSQATLDSLDLGRYSEDGSERIDERVAILEFELRKAKETISSLRANLTLATSENNSDNNNLEGVDGATQIARDGTIKPHEQRALNFLINEYLLQYAYKYTSITFAEENQDQDFEDWDDVGLNIPKPSELLKLYRDALHLTCYKSMHDKELQTEFDYNKHINDLNKQIHNKDLDIEKLKKSINELELEKLEFKIQYDNVIKYNMNKNSENSSSLCDTKVTDNNSVVNLALDDNGSGSGEKFEIIESNKDNKRNIQTRSDNSQDSLITLDEYDGDNDNKENSDIKIEDNNSKWKKSKLTDDQIYFDIDQINRNYPKCYKQELFRQCFKNIFENAEINRIFEELKINNNTVNEQFFTVLTKTLENMIPNIVVNKREEIIPLLVCAICLIENNNERDLLIQQLFNLKKRPCVEERQKILSGIIELAKLKGCAMVDNEILPQCWEQLHNKYIEKRLLVAETCLCLVPYVSSTIRNSLMVSMLQQMLNDEKEFLIRELSVQTFTLIIGVCDDVNKYEQFQEITFKSILNDTNKTVLETANQLLIPVLAYWAFDLGKFEESLLRRLLKKLDQMITKSSEILPEEKIIEIFNIFNSLLPFIFVYVIKSEYVLNRYDVNTNNKYNLPQDFLSLCTPLTNPDICFENRLYSFGCLFNTFNSIINDTNVEFNSNNWHQYFWLENIFLKDLMNLSNYIQIDQINLLNAIVKLFYNISKCFGKIFTEYKLLKLIEIEIEKFLKSLNNFSLNTNSTKLILIPIYLVLLNSIEDYCEISECFKRFINSFSLSGVPIKCLRISLSFLCDDNFNNGIKNVQLEQCIIDDVLWPCVLNDNVLIKCSSLELFSTLLQTLNLDDNLLIKRVAPALVTLITDPDPMVRSKSIPCLGDLITCTKRQEIHEKAYMQLQSILNEPQFYDDHSLLCNVIETLGKITNSSQTWFTDQVILPQLAAVCSHTSQMKNNLTRQKDLALLLLEAFSQIIYSPMSNQTITTNLWPALKYLENVEISNMYQERLKNMIKDVESRIDSNVQANKTNKINDFLTNSQKNQTKNQIGATTSLSQNVNHGMEEMKQKMSKIFQPNLVKNVPTNISSFQNIFKKK